MNHPVYKNDCVGRHCARKKASTKKQISKISDRWSEVTHYANLWIKYTYLRRSAEMASYGTGICKENEEKDNENMQKYLLLSIFLVIEWNLNK